MSYHRYRYIDGTKKKKIILKRKLQITNKINFYDLWSTKNYNSIDIHFWLLLIGIFLHRNFYVK